ncbi:MAG: class I SAM-dependent methyltransferase [Microbacteriaceae bacterium]|nr:class I SAM-dependent methyltransferase [Microbacteriaceae bacterium]
MNQSADHWNERYRDAESVWSLEPNQFVVEYLSELSMGSMVDIAGGEGRNALWFARRGWTVENSDFSDVAVEKFRERASRAGVLDRCVGTVSSALESSACQTGPVDLAVIAYLQLALADLAVAIAVASGALKPAGTFFGVWHERGNVGRGLGGPQIPELNPTVDELVAHARSAGLTVDVCELRERSVTRNDVTGSAIDVVLACSR